MLEVKRIVTGIIQENCYLVYNENHLLIVDPGDYASTIKQTIEKTGSKPIAVLITHTHYDHIGAVDAMREEYNIPAYVSPLEQEWLGNPELNLSGRINHKELKDLIVQPAEYEFEINKTYTLEDIKFKVVATPGHSIGSVSFIFDGFVMTGDALFKNSIGRTDLHTGDLNQLIRGIQSELFTLPDDYTVYPGHGDKTTIGYEKMTNPFLK